MRRVAKIALWTCVSTFASTATADVDHLETLAQNFASEGDRFLTQGEWVRALEEYSRVFRYDSTHGVATHAAVRLAHILYFGARARVPGLVPFRKPQALLLLRYAVGTPDPERATAPSPLGLDSLAEARSLHARITGNRSFTDRPLSNVPGGRKGRDANLPDLESIARSIVGACHAKMPRLGKGGYERELGIIRSESQDPANQAMRELLATKASLSPATRLELFRAACSDWHAQDHARPGPCDLLAHDFAELGWGIEDGLDRYLDDPDPGLRQASELFLAQGRGFAPSQAVTIGRRFLRDLDAGSIPTPGRLQIFRGVPVEVLQGPFQEQLADWAERAHQAGNPDALAERIAIAYRALSLMGDPGRELVGRVAERAKSDVFLRRGAAVALLASGEPAELPRLEKIVRTGGAVVQESLAFGLGTADVAMWSIAAVLVERGNPETAYRTIRALDGSRVRGPALAPLFTSVAGTALARRDLGDKQYDVYAGALRLLDRVDTADVCTLLDELRTDDARLVYQQVEIARSKAAFAPDACARVASRYLDHPEAKVRDMARRAVDRTGSERRIP